MHSLSKNPLTSNEVWIRAKAEKTWGARQDQRHLSPFTCLASVPLERPFLGGATLTPCFIPLHRQDKMMQLVATAEWEALCRRPGVRHHVLVGSQLFMWQPPIWAVKALGGGFIAWLNLVWDPIVFSRRLGSWVVSRVITSLETGFKGASKAK